MPTIIADDKIPFLRGVLEPMARVRYLPGREIARHHLSDADALIIRTRTRCNEALLGGTSVKYIATAASGHDHIDAAYCRRAGIRWSNAPGCNAGSVQQYIAAALTYIANHEKKKFDEITLGVIGVGHVGKKVEQLACTLNMKVMRNDPPRKRAEGDGAFTDLDTLLTKSDVVSMHVPLNREGDDKTCHMCNETFFGKMKKGAWFVNTARGEVMHTKSLKDAIEAGHLGGIVLDVWEEEPQIDRKLLRLAAIATPHIAGYSLDGKANGTARSVQALSRFFKLGMDQWYPANIPEPESPAFSPAKDTKTREELMHQVFMHTYDIRIDSQRLKGAPGMFEKLRDAYPPRREFHACSVVRKDLNPSDAKILSQLGFTLI